MVVDEASPRCNMATDICAQVDQAAFADLKATPQMVSPPHAPVPSAATLEDLYIPSAARIAEAVQRTLGHGPTAQMAEAA